MDKPSLRERVFIWVFAPVAIAISVLVPEEESELGSDAWPPTWQPPRKPTLIDRVAVRLGILADSGTVRCCPNCDAERRQP
jgi:hypothetical protein